MVNWAVKGLGVGVLLGMCLAQGSLLNDAYAAKVQAAVAKVWPRMDHIWPSSGFGNLYLLLTNGTDYWVIHSGGLEKKPYAEAPERIRANLASTFAMTTYQGKPAIAIRQLDVLPGEKVPSVFGFATHEAFHLHVQTKWSSRATIRNGRRSVDYPLKTAPRLYRRLVFEQMVMALLGGEKGLGIGGDLRLLGGAKYWWERWKREFPAEAQRIQPTDITEGTAEYAQTVANIYAVLGPNPTSDDVQHETLDQIRTLLDVRERFATLDNESYPLGALAGLLLDQVHPGWKINYANEPQPLPELLLEGVPEIEQPLPQSHWITNMVVLAQRRVAGTLDAFLAGWRDQNRVLVVLPSVLKGTVGLSGFFANPDVGDSILAALNAQMEWPGGKVTLSGHTVSQGPAPACGNAQYVIFPINSRDFALSGETAKFNLPSIQGEFVGAMVEYNGRRYLCSR